MAKQSTKFLKMALALTALMACATLSSAQSQSAPVTNSVGSWTPLNNQPTFAARLSLLLTDGRVFVQENSGATWHTFSPDSTGSYVNGTWDTSTGGIPSTLPIIGGTQYAPLYYASAVLADGRVVIIGGEYNQNVETFTQMGAFYRPFLNQWLPLTPPTNTAGEGDAGSVILTNGTWMVQDPLNPNSAILNPNHQCLDDTINYWTNVAGTGKADRNDEEGWNLLRDGTVLTVDAIDAPNSERFFPGTKTWTSAGPTGVRLEDPTSEEIGPAVLMPGGNVFATGACPAANGGASFCQPGTTGHTSVFTADTALSTGGFWNPGPNFPSENGKGVDIADGPASILPNGNVLMFASPGIFETGGEFFVYNGSAPLVAAPNTPNGPGDSSYYGSMLVLPTGQVWFTDGSGDVELFTSTGTPCTGCAPVIVTAPPTVDVCNTQTNSVGTTYTITGRQLNGASQGAYYGDDEQMATNYPLVRITNTGTGKVVYCKTHSHSSMAVGTGAGPTAPLITTQFDVSGSAPGSCVPDTGASTLEVVADGIPSAAQNVVVTSVGNTCAVISCGACACPSGGVKQAFEDPALIRY